MKTPPARRKPGFAAGNANGTAGTGRGKAKPPVPPGTFRTTPKQKSTSRRKD